MSTEKGVHLHTESWYDKEIISVIFRKKLDSKFQVLNYIIYHQIFCYKHFISSISFVIFFFLNLFIDSLWISHDASRSTHLHVPLLSSSALATSRKTKFKCKIYQPTKQKHKQQNQI